MLLSFSRCALRDFGALKLNQQISLQLGGLCLTEILMSAQDVLILFYCVVQCECNL